MTDELIFKPNSDFVSVRFDKETNSWHFYFSDNISVSPSEFWRLLIRNKISLVSFDHGQQFGLSHPVDLEEALRNLLTGKKLTEMKVDKDTGDLTLIISDNIKIQIFITSFGYETYEFCIENVRYLGLGSGEIGVVDKTGKPQFFTIRKL